MENKITFNELGLSKHTLEVLLKKGFEKPTPIQAKTIPALISGTKDIVGQAQTGTGKTAAFGLPLIENLSQNSKHVQALILTPTRELAIQVAEEINSLKGKNNLQIIPIYGGQSINLQLSRLKRGVDIVVGTPGRILDHLDRKTLKLDKISYMILDEADEMLNMGFLDDVKDIMKNTPKEKRTLLFSATMPDEIMQIAKRYMREYDLFKVNTGALTVASTNQIYFEVSQADKFEALCRIIDMEEEFYGLIFCRTKNDVDNTAKHLIDRSYDADALHGDISQSMRIKILDKFKKKSINILVATDVAARGIDVRNLTHVINYSLPQDPESYVHRIGRTGRAGKGGTAITFITPSEYRKLQFIQRKTKTDIKRAKLPKAKDVIKLKQQRLKTEIENIINLNSHKDYIEISKELLDDNRPEDVLAAILHYSFRDELKGKDIDERDDIVVDTKGKTRLFVKQGKMDGLTAKKLEEFIMRKCKVSSNKISDIAVLEKFSFVTLPFGDAEKLLSSIQKEGDRADIIITKAKKKK